MPNLQIIFMDCKYQINKYQILHKFFTNFKNKQYPAVAASAGGGDVERALLCSAALGASVPPCACMHASLLLGCLGRWAKRQR